MFHIWEAYIYAAICVLGWYCLDSIPIAHEFRRGCLKPVIKRISFCIPELRNRNSRSCQESVYDSCVCNALFASRRVWRLGIVGALGLSVLD